MDSNIKQLERLVAEHPREAKHWAQLATAYAECGDIYRAGPPADRAAELDPAFEQLAFQWGEWRTLGRNSSRCAWVPHSLFPTERPDISIRWQAPVAPVRGPVAISSGVAYSPEGRSQLVARDFATGEERWRTELELPGGNEGTRVLTSPSVADGLVVLWGHDRRSAAATWAVETASGRMHWQRESGGRLENFFSDSATPVISRGLVVSAWEKSLVAIDLSTGDERWCVELVGKSLTPPIARDGRVYVAVVPHRQLIAFDLSSGRRIWSVNTGLEDAIGSLAATECQIVCGDYRRFAAYSASDGNELWCLGGPNTGIDVAATSDEVTVAQDIFSTGATRTADGNDVWDLEHVNDNLDIRGGTAIVGDVALFADGVELVAADLLSGEERFRHKLPGLPRSAPIAVPNAIAITCNIEGETVLVTLSVD